MRPQRSWAALAILAISVLAAGCGGGGHKSGTPSASGPTSGRQTVTTGSAGGSSGSGGSTFQLRVVDVMPPGSGPVDVMAQPPDGGPPKTLASGQSAGTVSDWIRVPLDGASSISAGGRNVTFITKPRQSSGRITVVVGKTDQGDFTSTAYDEEGARIVAASGDVGTQPLTTPRGKDLVVASGIGNGVRGEQSYGFFLGQPGKGCLQSPGLTPTSGSSVGTEVPFFADPGPVELAWYLDPSCKHVDSAAAHVQLARGEQAYAITWFSDQTHLRMLVLPVQATGAGNAGLIDSGPGPAFTTDTFSDSGAG